MISFDEGGSIRTNHIDSGFDSFFGWPHLGSAGPWSSSETSTGVVFGPFFSVAIRSVFGSGFGSIFNMKQLVLENCSCLPPKGFVSYGFYVKISLWPRDFY